MHIGPGIVVEASLGRESNIPRGHRGQSEILLNNPVHGCGGNDTTKPIRNRKWSGIRSRAPGIPKVFVKTDLDRDIVWESHLQLGESRRGARWRLTHNAYGRSKNILPQRPTKVQNVITMTFGQEVVVLRRPSNNNTANRLKSLINKARVKYEIQRESLTILQDFDD